MFKKYKIDWKFVDTLGATSPPPVDTKAFLERADCRTDKELQARADAGEPVLEPEALREVALAERPEEEEEIKVSRFKRDNDGLLYLKPYEIKAHLREIAGYLSREDGEKGLKARVAQTLFVMPTGHDIKTPDPKIFLLDHQGNHCKVADGADEIKGRVTGLRGPRSIISRLEFLVRPQVSFAVWVLANSPVNTKLETLLELGGVKGFGGARCSREWGKYDYEITSI